MTQLQTSRLTLRPYRASEADLLGSLLRDRRVFFWREDTISHAEIAEVIARSESLRPSGLGWFAAFTREDNEFVGNAILQPLRDTEDIEIGYHLAPGHWGKGYATEAAGALLDHGFKTLALPRIVAVALPENDRSLRVLQRLGLPYIEDRIHADLLHRYFALSRTDYLATHSAVTD